MIVKRFAASLARRFAPETMRSLEELAALRRSGESLPGLVTRAEQLEARVAELAELEYAVNELRRDSLRIAELADLVVTRVGALPAMHEPQPR